MSPISTAASCHCHVKISESATALLDVVYTVLTFLRVVLCKLLADKLDRRLRHVAPRKRHIRREGRTVHPHDCHAEGHQMVLALAAGRRLGRPEQVPAGPEDRPEQGGGSEGAGAERLFGAVFGGYPLGGDHGAGD